MEEIKKLAVTGATGFVGTNLKRYLRPLKMFSIVEVKRSDLLDSKDFITNLLNRNSTEIVVHLAGKAHDLKRTSNPSEYYEINFDLTKKLYDSFLHSDAKKFIFISTVKAVIDHLDGLLTEDFTAEPKTDYGRSKLMAEDYIQNQKIPEGKSFYILRPCMIHGPGNKGNLNLLYTFVTKGLPYPLAAFTNKRSFLSVENLCFVIKELSQRDDIPSGIYNVADDEALSTIEIVKLLAQSLDKSPRLLNVPSCFIKFFARLGDFFYLPLNTERLEKLTESYIVSNSKIKSVLKKELPLSVGEGIFKTACSFKDV